MSVAVNEVQHGIHGDEHEHSAHLAHHFDTPIQQFDSGKLGIWLFLLTEVLFFSGLFCAYAVYRSNHPEVFLYGHHFLDKTLGAINTIVLLISSLTAAWSVRCAQKNNKKGIVVNIVITLLCAFTFMGIKAVEYTQKYEHGLLWGRHFHPAVHGEGHGEAVAEPPKDAHVFFGIYFAMTGLHGIHVLGGIILFIWLLLRALRGEFSSEYFGPIDYAALYWHLVDLIWIYLFPLLYLIE